MENLYDYQKLRTFRTVLIYFLMLKGIIINADVNGAYNILKKAFLNAVDADRIEDVRLHPT
jgi:hypothetical protein